MHVQVDIARGLKVIAPGKEVHSVQEAISIHVDRRWGGSRKVEAALRTEDAAHVNFPRELHDPIQKQRMTQREVRRATVEVRAVIEFPGLRDRVAVAGN